MNFELSNKTVVTAQILNTKALQKRIQEDFGDAISNEALQVNIDEDEYQLINLVQKGKLSVFALNLETLTKADAYGLFPSGLFTEAKHSASKLDKLNDFLMGKMELVVVSKNKYNRLKHNLPEDVIPFVTTTEGKTIIFYDNLWSDFGSVKKGQDINKLKWEASYGYFFENKKINVGEGSIKIKREDFDPVEVEIDENNLCITTAGSIYNIFCDEPERQLNELLCLDSYILTDSDQVHPIFKCEYAVLEKKLTEKKVKRDIDLGSLENKVRDLVNIEQQEFKHKTQIIKTYIQSEGGSSEMHNEVVFAIYGFVRI